MICNLASSHVPSYTMSNGVTLRNFTRTRYGALSDLDLKKPGNFLCFIVGQANGSSAWNTVEVSDDYRYQYPNPRWNGISTSFSAIQLLLNPMQPRTICRGKMLLDLSPKITPCWLGSFLDTWFRFIQRNPQVICFLVILLYFIVFFSLRYLIYMFLLTLFTTVHLVYLLQVFC